MQDPPKVAVSTGARARAIHILRSLGTFLLGQLVRVRDSSPYTYQPASIRDVVAYTKRGGWIPGKHPWWVESPGYGFGWLVAIPVTVVTVPLLFVTQRPMRAAAFGVTYGLLIWSGVGWLVQVPLRFAGHVLMFLSGGS